MNTEVRDVLNNWDIPQDLPIRGLSEKDGVYTLGHIWFIGDRYVLKRGARDHLLRNFHITKALAEQGISDAPLYAKNGRECVQSIDSDEVFILMSYVTGKALTDDEIRCQKMPEYGYKLGQNLAKLHIALLSVEEFISAKDTDIYKNVSEWAIPKVKEANSLYNMGFADNLFDDYIETFGKLCQKLPKQLIHRDSHPQNIIFNKGEVSGFIDFDISERNLRLVDICYGATGIGFDYLDMPERWLEVLKEILKGYNSVSPLTAEEKHSVFYVTLSVQFICVAAFAGSDKYKSAWEENRKLTPFVTNLKDRIIEISMSI